MEITTTAKNNQLERQQEPQFFLEKMTSSEIAIVQATEGKRIGQMTENEKTLLAGKIVSIGNVRLGYKPKSDQETKTEIYLFVLDLNKFLGLTEQELLLALNSGLDGEFLKENESVFFNSANFVQWCKKYIESKKMPAMTKHHNNKVVAERETVKPVPSMEVRKAVINEIILDHVEKLSENIDFDFIFDCGELYGELENVGIFQFSINEKFEIYDFIKKKYPNQNDEALRKKAKHEAWVRYIVSLIKPTINELPLQPKKNARETVKMVY